MKIPVQFSSQGKIMRDGGGDGLATRTLRALCSGLVPSAALLKRHAFAAKDVQRTADGEVDAATAEALHELEVLDVPAAASVRNGDGADLSQVLDKLLVDAGLQTFGICGVDQKLGAVRFQHRDVFCSSRVRGQPCRIP